MTTEDSKSNLKLREIKASEILDKIQKSEPVMYDHVKITDDLDLNMLNLPTEHVARTEFQKETLNLPEKCKVISSKITFTDSVFEKSTNFSNHLLLSDIYFHNILFGENVNFRGSVIYGNAVFTNVTFGFRSYQGADFIGTKFSKSALFTGAEFVGYAIFRGASFGWFADFSNAKFSCYKDDHADFSGNANFSKTTFKKAKFRDATFDGSIHFSGATFESKADFSRVTIKGASNFVGDQVSGDTDFKEDAVFTEAIFGLNADFRGTIFGRRVYFDEAKIGDEINFDGTIFKGDLLTFRRAIFKSPEFQEILCRKAKIIMARAGNRDMEEYHFYQEMIAKRQQQGLIKGSFRDQYNLPLRSENLLIAKRFLWHDIFEYIFIQKIFGYGVHPWRLMGWWIAIIVVFGILYYNGNDVNGTAGWECMTISFATGVAPGYAAAIIQPVSSGSSAWHFIPEYKILAMIETIFGTFLWAGFIGTFAKRYMR